MKNAVAIVVFACLLAMTTVVAAGVMRVLGEIVIGLAPTAREDVLVWIVVGIIGVASSLMFLAGSIPLGMKVLRRIG